MRRYIAAPIWRISLCNCPLFSILGCICTTFPPQPRLVYNMAGPASLPATFDDLPDKRRYWPAPAGSEEEGLGMLRLLTPDVVAQAAQTQIKTGERVCLNWDIENLTPPGNLREYKRSIPMANTRQDSAANRSSTASNGSPRASHSTTSTTSTRSNHLNGTDFDTTMHPLPRPRIPSAVCSTAAPPRRKSKIPSRRASASASGPRRALPDAAC